MVVSGLILFFFQTWRSTQTDQANFLSPFLSRSLISDQAVFQMYWPKYKHAHLSITCPAPDSFPWYFIITAVVHDVIWAALCETVSVSGTSSCSCSASLSGTQMYKRKRRGHECAHVCVFACVCVFVLLFLIYFSICLICEHMKCIVCTQMYVCVWVLW